jgi:hypothetical protein
LNNWFTLEIGFNLDVAFEHVIDELPGEGFAMHGKAQRKHSVLTFPPHHQGIPLGARRAEGKLLIHLRQSAPEVEKRSWAAYERVANGGGR